jgi:hypothetical protein
VVRFQLAIPATAATNLADIGEIAVADQNPKLYILDGHNEI